MNWCVGNDKYGNNKIPLRALIETIGNINEDKLFRD